MSTPRIRTTRNTAGQLPNSERRPRPGEHVSSTPRLPDISRWGGSDTTEQTAEVWNSATTPRAAHAGMKVTTSAKGFEPHPPSATGGSTARGRPSFRSSAGSTTSLVRSSRSSRKPKKAAALNKQTLQSLITTMTRRVACNMKTLDVLGAKEVERRARLRKLKDEFRDVCKNSDAQKSGKAGVGGSVPPNLVRLRAEVKKVEAAFKHCLEERFSMEVIRERMENERLASVTRLREHREVLIKNDLVDKQLISGYLANCKTLNEGARKMVGTRKRKLRDEKRKRDELLDTMRSEQHIAALKDKIEFEGQATVEEIEATLRGDLDSQGEKQLRKKTTEVVAVSALSYAKNHQAREREYELSKTLQKLKDATGAENEADLLFRFQQLAVNTATLEKDKDDTSARHQQLEEQKREALDALEQTCQIADSSKVTGFGEDVRELETHVRKAEDDLKIALPGIRRLETIIFNAQWTMQSMTSLLGLDNATSGGQRGSKPAPPNGTRQLSGTDLIRRLDGCSQKALDMLTTLPPRFKKMTDAHRNVSMQVANSEGNNLRTSMDMSRFHAEQEILEDEHIVDVNINADAARDLEAFTPVSDY